MRTANFRDSVLWAIAYKLGLDPAIEFLTDEAESLTSYINAWVRRTWDSADWPEWTETFEFTVGANHMVPYLATPISQTEPVLISRPLKVYLADPSQSPYPIDTSFRLNDQGLHVGFDHGSTVWIKFVPEAPVFTSRQWDADVTYSNGALTYSRDTGQCYKSQTNGNIGRDPAIGLKSPLITTTVQEAVAGSPAIPASNEKWGISVDPPNWYSAGVGGADIDYLIKLKDPSLVEHQFTYTTTGGLTLDAFLDALIAAAAASTDTFINSATWTKDTANKLLLVEKAEVFTTASSQVTASPGGVAILPGQQISAFYPGSPEVLPRPQVTLVTLPSSLIPGATYELTLIDAAGTKHQVRYYSSATDGASQILDGLAAAFVSGGASDPFLTSVDIVIDYGARRLSLSVPQTFSITAIAIAPTPNPWWEEVLFPYALVEPVVRGAYADALREAGQSDKALVEEQGTVQERDERMTKALAPGYDDLTDQRAPAPRYRAKLVGQQPPAGR
jgi:hypothetical protein